MTSCEEISVACYEQALPDGLGATLDRLYGARYASLAHFQIYGFDQRASTYLAWRDGEPISALVYQRGHKRLTILNEGVAIDAAELERFATHAFASDPALGAIAFNFIEAPHGPLAFPSLCLPCGEDTVLTLPDSVEQYRDSLGGSTRSTLKYRMNKLKRDHPTFTFTLFERDTASEADMRAIIALNRTRMQSKDKRSSIDAAEEERIIAYARRCGLVGVVMIEGRLCAGAIMYHLGRNVSARILAHDPAFDSYRVGFLGAYLSICACIERAGGGQLYFGWGQNAYKANLGGHRRELSRLIIYRSRAHMLRHAGTLAHAIGAAAAFRAKNALLLAAQGGDTAVARSAGAVVDAARWLKRRSSTLRLRA